MYIPTYVLINMYVHMYSSTEKSCLLYAGIRVNHLICIRCLRFLRNSHRFLVLPCLPRGCFQSYVELLPDKCLSYFLVRFSDFPSGDIYVFFSAVLMYARN
jgi:hypothetical protein